MEAQILLQPLSGSHPIEPVVQTSEYWWAQPLATVLAAVGVIVAASIAFHSQQKSRKQQHDQHVDLLSLSKADHDAQQKAHEASLRAQRDEWMSRLRNEGRRERLTRVIESYSAILGRMSLFEAEGTVHATNEGFNLAASEQRTMRTQRAITTLILGDRSGDPLFYDVSRVPILSSSAVNYHVDLWVKLAIRGSAINELQVQRDLAV